MTLPSNSAKPVSRSRFLSLPDHSHFRDTDPEARRSRAGGGGKRRRSPSSASLSRPFPRPPPTCSGRRRVLGFPLSAPRGHVTGEGAGYKKCFTFRLPERPAGQFLDLWSPFPEDPLGSLPWPGAGDSSALRPARVTPRTSPPLGGCHSRAEGPRRKKGRARRAEAGTCAILRLPHRARPALELRVEVVTATSVGVYFAASWSSP